MKKKQLALLFAAMLAVSSLAGCSQNQPADTKQETVTEKEDETTKEEESKAQEVEVKDLDSLAEGGIIAGIEDLKIAEGTDIDLNSLVFVDDSIVKSVDIDDSNVDYTKAGTYEVIYTITFDSEALRDYIEENDLTVSFNTDGDAITVKVTVTVIVMDQADAETAVKDGDTEVITNETKANVQSAIQAQAAPTAKPSTGSTNSGSGNQGTPGNTSNNTDNRGNSSNIASNSGNSGNTANNGNNNSGNQNSGTTNNHSNGSGNNSGTTDTNKGNNHNSGNNGSSSSTNTPTSNPNNNNNAGSSNNNNSGNKTPAHTHSYTSTVTKDATCGTDGVKTYTCSCGDSYTESIPATGRHNWVDQTESVWIDDVIVGYDSYDMCTGCGKHFPTGSWDANEHATYCSPGASVTHKTEAIWEDGHFETQVTGQKCSICGLTK